MPLLKIFEGEKLLKQYDADIMPVTGDFLFQDGIGPYLVKSRTWEFPELHNNFVYSATIRVERVKRSD